MGVGTGQFCWSTLRLIIQQLVMDYYMISYFYGIRNFPNSSYDRASFARKKFHKLNDMKKTEVLLALLFPPKN
jgi:hypothetical protein